MEETADLLKPWKTLPLCLSAVEVLDCQKGTPRGTDRGHEVPSQAVDVETSSRKLHEAGVHTECPSPWRSGLTGPQLSTAYISSCQTKEDISSSKSEGCVTLALTSFSGGWFSF